MPPRRPLSRTLQVSSSASAADGFYIIGVTATNGANMTYTGSTSATYVIVSLLTVAVSTDKSSYIRNKTVSITANANANGSPVANARVTFTIMKQGGAKVTGTATTRTSGSAVFKYKLKRSDPRGVYQVRAGAKLNNAMFGSAGTSFTVQ